MKPIMRGAFAVFLVVAMLAGGNARGETTTHGACVTANHSDPFDGDIVIVTCWEGDNMIFSKAHVVVSCVDNTTDLFVLARIKEGKEVSKEGLSLRTALDDTETPKWDYEFVGFDYYFVTILIKSAIPVIKEMLEHSRFRFRITEGNDVIHNGDIAVSGLGEAIKPVRVLCQW